MILLLGPAGSGKGVQGRLLADKLGWRWLSMGALLRESDDPAVQAMLKRGNPETSGKPTSAYSVKMPVNMLRQ